MKAATLGSAFIWSLRVFQRRLPLQDNESIPNFVARFLGNRHRFLLVGRILQPLLHEIPKYMRGANCSYTMKYKEKLDDKLDREFFNDTLN